MIAALTLTLIQELLAFAELLSEIASIIGGVLKSFHIFFITEEAHDSKIAFNHNGSIFFSVGYHMREVDPPNRDSNPNKCPPAR